MSFIDTIKERAKKDKKRIVLPESMDKRTMEAADKALKEKMSTDGYISFLDDLTNVYNVNTVASSNFK